MFFAALHTFAFSETVLVVVEEGRSRLIQLQIQEEGRGSPKSSKNNNSTGKRLSILLTLSDHPHSDHQIKMAKSSWIPFTLQFTLGKTSVGLLTFKNSSSSYKNERL